MGDKLSLLDLRHAELASDGAEDLLSLAKVDGLDGAAESVLHILDHLADVSDVGVLLVNDAVALLLAGEGTGETDAADGLVGGLDREHDGGGELVVRVLLAVNDLHDVDGVPAALHGLALLGAVLGLLEEDAGGKAVVEVPAVDGGDAALVVELSVGVEDVVHLDLLLAKVVRGDAPVGKRGVVLVGPGGAVGVGVSVVVAEEVVTLRGGVVGDLKRLIDGGEEVLNKVGDEVEKPAEVVLEVRGGKSSHEVKCTIKLVCHFFFLILYLCSFFLFSILIIL